VAIGLAILLQRRLVTTHCHIALRSAHNHAFKQDVRCLTPCRNSSWTQNGARIQNTEAEELATQTINSYAPHYRTLARMSSLCVSKCCRKLPGDTRAQQLFLDIARTQEAARQGPQKTP
jgi:hypothetical protein